MNKDIWLGSRFVFRCHDVVRIYVCGTEWGAGGLSVFLGSLYVPLNRVTNAANDSAVAKGIRIPLPGRL